MTTFVYDASAIIALLKGERGADRTEYYLTLRNSDAYIHGASITEVYYHFLKVLAYSEILADQRLLNLWKRLKVYEGNTEFWHRIAEVKHQFRMSLGDSIVVATGERLNATIITADHPDFEPIAAAGVCPVVFIRDHNP